MRFHSQVYDDFFDNPESVRKFLEAEPMKDEIAEDGVTYPGIVRLPEIITNEIRKKTEKIIPDVNISLMFARYSFSQMLPPHWAHSDKEMADFVGLIYLSPKADEMKDGTLLLRHKVYDLETHPEEGGMRDILIKHANTLDMWEETFYFPARYNRMAILSADYIHAAASRFGFNKDEARLVITVFFKLKPA
jgi:hypothetical protein